MMGAMPRRALLVIGCLALAVVVPALAPRAAAELSVPPGFVTAVYLTGEGFGGQSGSVRGIPSSASLAFDARGFLYIARTGRRYGGGEDDYLSQVFRFPPGPARLTPQTEARFLYGPPLPNPAIGFARGAGELFLTTFDRDRKIGVLYRMVDGRAVLTAGGTPAPGAAAVLRQPEGVAADSAGHLYVADRDQGVVIRLDAAGRVLDPRYAAVRRPRALAVDTADRLWIGGDGDADVPWTRGAGELWTVTDGAARLASAGPRPIALAAGPVGSVFVADRLDTKIFAVGADGRRVDVVKFTDGDSPRAIAFAPDTPETRRAGIAGDLFVINTTRGVFAVNEVLRISGPFAEFVGRP